MARIFITGSADGLGNMAAKLLVEAGHQVVLHARNPQRAKDAMSDVPGAETVVTGDLSVIAETKQVAQQANELGVFDAIIHNAAVGYREGRRIETVNGLPHVFAVNSLAPYILTCLIKKPRRLIYTSSALHRSGDATLNDLDWKRRICSGYSAYADSKLHNTILAFAVASCWKDVLSNAVEPGWVATKMGGAEAPDSLEDGPKTQVWLAAGNDQNALVSGEYFYHKTVRNYLPAAADFAIQERFLAQCEHFSGIKFPDA